MTFFLKLVQKIVACIVYYTEEYAADFTNVNIQCLLVRNYQSLYRILLQELQEVLRQKSVFLHFGNMLNSQAFIG